LNIYDEEGNEIANYRDIGKILLGNIGNGNLQLGDDGQYTVNFFEMMNVYMANSFIVNTNSFMGIPTSKAAKYLLEDGYMSPEEALELGNKVMASLFGPNLIEHYSARKVLTEDIKTYDEFLKKQYEKAAKENNRYHVNGNDPDREENSKYTKLADPGMGVESYEIIINGNKIITDSINGGSSNFANFVDSTLLSRLQTGTAHAIKDVLPYYFLGNDPIDLGTTNLPQRIGGWYRGTIPQYMQPWFGIKK
jgi:hypothetical protein